MIGKFCKTFANDFVINVKLSKTKISKIFYSGVFFDKAIGLLLKIGLSIAKNVFTPLIKLDLYH